MKRLTRLTAVLALLALFAPATATALGQALPPGPTTAVRSDFPVDSPPGQFDLVQLVLDFAPGAFTPVHTHGGQAFVTVLEGQMTVREQGAADKTFRAGETWVEIPGEFAAVGNAGTTRASILVSFLLPEGAALTTVQQGGSTQQLPPGPTTRFRSNFEVATPPPAPFDVVHLVLEFAPGAFTPPHSHGGPGFVTVLGGQMVVREGGTERAVQPFETWTEDPREVAVVGNPGQQKASIAVTFLLPKGAPLTTVATQAAVQVPRGLPRTGEADASPVPAWLLLIGGAGLAAGGWLARRQGVRVTRVSERNGRP